MTTREKIEDVVYGAVDELNKQLPAGVQIGKSADSVIYGRHGKLESLDFLTLIMEVEARVKDDLGIELVLSNESLLSEHDSQFRTVGTLIDFLESTIEKRMK